MHPVYVIGLIVQLQTVNILYVCEAEQQKKREQETGRQKEKIQFSYLRDKDIK